MILRKKSCLLPPEKSDSGNSNSDFRTAFAKAWPTFTGKSQKQLMKCIQLTITGDIYGTGMRFSALHFASELGVNGFAQYNSRGEIIIEAEGGEEQLREFVRLCRECAASFVVSGVEVNECEKTGYTSFDIRHGLHDGGTQSNKATSPTLMKSFFTRVRHVFSSGKNFVKADNQ